MLASALCLHFISQAFKIDVAYRMMCRPHYSSTFCQTNGMRDGMYAEVIWRHAKNAREEIVEETLAFVLACSWTRGLVFVTNHTLYSQPPPPQRVRRTYTWFCYILSFSWIHEQNHISLSCAIHYYYYITQIWWRVSERVCQFESVRIHKSKVKIVDTYIEILTTHSNGLICARHKW